MNIKKLSLPLLVTVLFFQTTAFTMPNVQATVSAMPGKNLVCKTIGVNQICASVSSALPARYTYVTIYGQLKVNGILQKGKAMKAVWHYKTSVPYCSGVTTSLGLASCTRYISGATKAYKVNVDVTIGGYTVTTSFTPQ